MSTTPEPEEIEEPNRVQADPSCVNGKSLILKDCGSACQLTCDNYHNPPADCPRVRDCCFCPEGMVERSDGWCVPPFACPGELFCLTLLDYMNIALTIHVFILYTK